MEYIIQNDGGNGNFCFVLEDKERKVMNWNEVC